MQRDTVMKRLGLVLVLVIVSLTVSACYKDAGEDLQPTSRQVNLTDIAPTATPAPPTATASHTPPPTDALAATATRTLVPTTTPAGFVAEPATETPEATRTAMPTEEAVVQSTGADSTPTQLSLDAPTPAGTPTATRVLIATPGMSDILPSDTPVPTIDPSFQPTPTPIPVEENPCIHVVKPNDTLYSIARDNDVVLADLVAANAEYLGGNPLTPLQIGWQLNIPGCETEESASAGDDGTVAIEGEVTATAQPQTEDGQIIHTVQAGEGIYAIARQYGVDPQAIIDANNLVNPHLIYPGDQLVIPVGQ